MNIPYTKIYPWQLITRSSNIMLDYKFQHTFDIEKLKHNLNHLIDVYKPTKQHDVYHNGKWEALCLIAINGDIFEDRRLDGEYKETPLMNEVPYIQSIVRSFPGKKHRVRLLFKQPKTSVYWHTDESETYDKGLIRLHIPIQTNPDYKFQISHHNATWKEGELWYGDFSFPHRLKNDSPSEYNVHLVIDIQINNKLLDFLGGDFKSRNTREFQKRVKLRKSINFIYSKYNYLFTLKRYIRLIKRHPEKVIPYIRRTLKL